jgi:hypothetical protein
VANFVPTCEVHWLPRKRSEVLRKMEKHPAFHVEPCTEPLQQVPGSQMEPIATSAVQAL